MGKKNCIVAQSGGPTVAINASLAGVVKGVKDSQVFDTIYGSVNGILGILNNNKLCSIGWKPRYSVLEGFSRTLKYLEIEESKK